MRVCCFILSELYIFLLKRRRKKKYTQNNLLLQHIGFSLFFAFPNISHRRGICAHILHAYYIAWALNNDSWCFRFNFNVYIPWLLAPCIWDSTCAPNSISCCCHFFLYCFISLLFCCFARYHIKIVFIIPILSVYPFSFYAWVCFRWFSYAWMSIFNSSIYDVDFSSSSSPSSNCLFKRFRIASVPLLRIEHGRLSVFELF